VYTELVTCNRQVCLQAEQAGGWSGNILGAASFPQNKENIIERKQPDQRLFTFFRD